MGGMAASNEAAPKVGPPFVGETAVPVNPVARAHSLRGVDSGLRIRWAPNLRTDRVVALCEANAAGLLDDALMDEVGWRLWERLA